MEGHSGNARNSSLNVVKACSDLLCLSTLAAIVVLEYLLALIFASIRVFRAFGEPGESKRFGYLIVTITINQIVTTITTI